MEDLEKYLTYNNKLLIFIRFKLRDWAKILANKKFTEKETEEIRGKLEQICDLMYGGHHKKLLETDELVTKLYYLYMDYIDEIRNEFEFVTTVDEKKKKPMSVKECVGHSEYIKALLESFPWEDDYGSLIQKAQYILFAKQPDGRVIARHQMAIDFVVQATGLSEERIRKKIKKIYKNG